MTRIDVKEKVLNENQRLAAELRRRFAEAGVFTLNLISSPGSGKTSLLERTLEAMPGDARVAVLTGDIQTENDARRLARAGFPVQQITTGGTCHLDARMITRALETWKLDEIDVLFIENVGNLVCPSSYDLGEHAKVVLLSVTEGEDKPLKYPSIFAKAELCVLNKMDLLPYVRFDMRQARSNVLASHPGMTIVETCCNSVDGVRDWIDWVNARRAAAFPAMATR
jgi:hydrogenase nickel incorporation protein HypB